MASKHRRYEANGTRERNKQCRAERRERKLAKAREKRAAKQAAASRFSSIWGHEREIS